MTLEHPGIRALTPLTPGRRNYARAVAGVARGFRRPLMPWQLHAAALATEQLPDGRWAYDELVTTVQRRAGKTMLRLPLTWHRALIRPGSRLWLTAQKRQDARDILVDEVHPLAKAAPRFLAGAAVAKLRRSQGSEGWHFTNGSTWRVFAPGEDDMHGKASEMVDVDEGWSLSVVQGAAVEQAVAPTRLTTDGQFAVFSTMGTATSTWFHGKVAKGHEALAAGAREGVAIIDFGIPDELVDVLRAQLEEGPDTPEWMAAMETLARHHPAYGYTITRVGAFSSVARQLYNAEVGGGPSGVLRALGNVPTDTAAAVIPFGRWTDLRPDEWPRPTVPLAWGVAVGRGDVDAAIMAAWVDAGTVYVDVVDTLPGAAWLPDRVDELADAWGHPPIGGDRVGGNVEILAELERRGHYVMSPTSVQYAGACAGILRAVEAGAGLAQPGDKRLDDDVKAAGTRPLGDAGWAWSRLNSAASIARLEAATVARWLVLELGDAAPPALHGG